MRSLRWHAALVAASSTALSGCVFNLGCELFGSLLQARMPQVEVCEAFNGACCPDDDGDGLPNECSGFLGTPPCTRFDTGSCFCTTSGEFTGIGQTLLPDPAAYALPTFGFGTVPAVAGFSGAQRAFFDVAANDLETFRSVIAYPAAFGFNGFLALGPAETQIGAYGVDFDGDGTVDLALPLRALGADTAYADGDGNGRFTAADPLLQHTGAHVFTTTLPRGGDGLARVTLGRVALHASVALYAGILVNPTTPGTYQLSGDFTSVDPDSGDADDATNQPPTTFSTPAVDVTIDPSPVAGLAPFLCYKTKPTKGGVPLAKNLAVTVDDQVSGLGAAPFTVAKGVTLCTPAATGGAGPPSDAATHLRGYGVKPAKAAPKPTALTLAPVTNALGTLVVDVKKADRLLVPSAKALGAPAPPLGATDVDDFECRSVKLRKKRCAQDPARKCKKTVDCGVDGPCLAGVPKGLTAVVGDQFTGFATPKSLAVGKPTRLCFASDLNGGGVVQVGAALLCYATKPASGAAKHEKIVGQIHTTNPLASEQLDTVKEAELCLPSLPTFVR